MDTHVGRDQLRDDRDRIADERDRLANERDQTALVREMLADERQAAADKRDRVADERQEAADKRDRVADEREHAVESRADVAEQEVAGLRVAMETRGVIEQAKGMIMLTLKIDADAAFNVLVRRSQTTHTKLFEVARDIVSTGLQRVE